MVTTLMTIVVNKRKGTSICNFSTEVLMKFRTKTKRRRKTKKRRKAKMWMTRNHRKGYMLCYRRDWRKTAEVRFQFFSSGTQLCDSV